MYLTIRKLILLPQYSKLKVIAGSSGLDNYIESCGILDYEYDNDVKNKYKHTNFKSNQLILSSLLYAKDNEYLLLDAIKNLISKGCCGLIIKNIFRININPNILRYADQNNFPIILIKSDDIYFEEMIVDISNLVKNYSSIYHYEKKVDYILTCKDDNKLIDLIKDINPSFYSDSIVFFLRFKNNNFINKYFEYSKKMFNNIDFNISDLFFYYKNGIMFIHTQEMFDKVDIIDIVKPYLVAFEEYQDNFYIGISSLHHNFLDYNTAINEAIYSSLLVFESEVNLYDSLGVYQLLLPFVQEDVFVDYSNKYISLIQDYDDENQTKLLDTISNYILCNGDLETTSQRLSIHKNSVRYRLEKVSRLVNENIFYKKGYEKISLAIKIYFCQTSIRKFKENLIKKDH